MVYVPRATVKALAAIRDENTKPSNSMFGLQSGEGIRSRIRDAAIHAGLGDGYTGHSPRVGMARDLARFGIQLPALMAAGRWKSPIMPAYYLRNGEAGRAIVADYYKCVLRDGDDPRRHEELDPTPKMGGYRDCRSRNG